MSLSFRTNGNFIDFVNTDATSLNVETIIMKLHNTSRCIDWSLPADTTRISFTIDEVKYSNILISEIDFDGTVMNSQDDFETGITEMFPGLAAGGEGGGGGVTNITYANLVTAINGSTLTAGTTYKITDRGDRGLFFTAISTNQLAKDGTRLMLCPATYEDITDGDGNVWKGVWNNTKNPDTNDLMIWGGKVWKNLTGNIGTAPSDILLDAVNWVLVSKTSFSNNEYVEKLFGVQFDVANDWIERQWDAAGNVFGADFSTNTNNFNPAINMVDLCDWNCQSATFLFFNNKCIAVYNNSNLNGIYSNTIPGKISNNSNTDSINNNINQGNIAFNTNTGVIEKNSNLGTIEENRCTAIYQNSNTGMIYNNSNAGEIFYNWNAADITSNSNDGSIYRNSNVGTIDANENDGDIEKNSNNGEISGNFHLGNIEKNSNTGDIVNCQSGEDPCNIFNNINNGNISGTFAADVNDTVVNKT